MVLPARGGTAYAACWVVDGMRCAIVRTLAGEAAAMLWAAVGAAGALAAATAAARNKRLSTSLVSHRAPPMPTSIAPTTLASVKLADAGRG